MISVKKQFIFFIILPFVFGSMFTTSENINKIIFISASVIPLIYGFSPIFIGAEKQYNKNYKNLIEEFNLLKKFLFIVIPYLIFTPTFINLTITSNVNKLDIVNILQSYIFDSPIFLIVVLAGLMRILFLIRKKDYGFYFSKGYCQIISEKKKEVEKMRNLLSLLKSYNRYIKQNLKLEINNIEKLYSIILYKDKEERNQIIESICISLETEKLNLAKYLASIYIIPDSEFYVKASILEELKLIGVILAAAIPIIISLIEIL